MPIDKLLEVLLGKHAPDQEDDKFLRKPDRHGNILLPTLGLKPLGLQQISACPLGL